MGLAKASGEYIAFIDSDDYLMSDFVEKLASGHADIAVCGYEEIVIDGKKFVRRPKNQQISGKEAAINTLILQTDMDVLVWNKLYKKKLFEKGHIKFPVGKKHEDNLTTFKILAQAKTVSYISDVLYVYERRCGSLTDEMPIFEVAEHKEMMASEAIKQGGDIGEAGEVAMLNAKLAFLDKMIANKKINDTLWQKKANWVIDNHKSLTKNKFLTPKLRTYVVTLIRLNGKPYMALKRILLRKKG
jgi:glycosyltransferase involved in cell wall biosynthesis